MHNPTFHINKSHQSNNLEYTVFAKASLLTAAASGSSHLVIVSSRVTITLLQRESSNAFTSHLQINSYISWKILKTLMRYQIPYSQEFSDNADVTIKWFIYMNSSAAVLKWNKDFSSLGTDESISFPFENSMLPRWRIAATTLNIASWEWKKVVRRKILETFYFSAVILNLKSIKLPVLQNVFQQHPLPFLLSSILWNHQPHPNHSNLIDSDNEMSLDSQVCTFEHPDIRKIKC